MKTDIFKRACLVGTPIISIETPDPYATVARLAAEGGDDYPAIQWDCANGFGAIPDSEVSRQLWQQISSQFTVDGEAANANDAFGMAQLLPENCRIFMHGMGRLLPHDPLLIQGIRNLREPFKKSMRTIVLLSALGQMILPPELATDTLMLIDPLPDRAGIEEVLDRTLSAMTDSYPDFPVPGDVERADVVAASTGLSAFCIEQNLAMSSDRKGINRKRLWKLKTDAIGAVPGLSVVENPPTFADLGGCDEAKDFYKRLMTGPRRPNAIVWIDEGEKTFSGQDDTSGVNQELLGRLLTEMQEHHWSGSIFLGPPGTAKSQFTKAIGGEFEIPTLAFDLSAMKNSLVGESGSNMRRALGVVEAISGGNVYAIMTCNSIATIPTALQRRFRFGVTFFDLPSSEERAAIWNIYGNRFGIQDRLPAGRDGGWTGAEIETCCDLAHAMGSTLEYASQRVIPVSVRNAAEINKLRAEADGRYLSASYPGTYRVQTEAERQAGTGNGNRRMRIDEE